MGFYRVYFLFFFFFFVSSWTLVWTSLSNEGDILVRHAHSQGLAGSTMSIS